MQVQSAMPEGYGVGHQPQALPARVDRARTCPATVLVLHGPKWGAAEISDELKATMHRTFLDATTPTPAAVWAAGGVTPVRIWPDTSLFEVFSTVQSQSATFATVDMSGRKSRESMTAVLVYSDTASSLGTRDIATFGLDAAGMVAIRRLGIVRDGGLRPGDLIVFQRRDAVGGPSAPTGYTVADGDDTNVVEPDQDTVAQAGTHDSVATAAAAAQRGEDDAADAGSTAGESAAAPAAPVAPAPAATEQISMADFDDVEV